MSPAVVIDRSLEIPWMILIIFWLVAACFTSRAVKQQSAWSRTLTIVAGALPFFLLFSRATRWSPLGWRIIPLSPGTTFAGLALTYAGIALAIWARVVLGKHWSGTITIKEGHRLIRSGPYSAVRHPIYSGLLLAVLGTALGVGELRSFVALAMSLAVWLVKSRLEERFMMEQFGREYEDYRQRTWALIPFIF
jgi:protein-S-isoprenylcysteine O-methyltransferase Ste14